MDFESLIKARRALDPLWKKEAWLKGRTWGRRRKNENNPYEGTNITLAIEKELVAISQGKNGRLKIHEFSKTQETSLGKRIREILRKEGLVLEDI